MHALYLQPTAALLRSLVFVYCIFNFSSFLSAVLHLYFFLFARGWCSGELWRQVNQDLK